MKIRLGYACICQTLDNITTSSTYTYTNFSKTYNYTKLKSTITSNLSNLIKILTYNKKNDIHFYRISSNLIPLATHTKVSFDYLNEYATYYKVIAKIIAENNMRIDMHPSTYAILNSTKKEVVDSTEKILKYHYNLLSMMEIQNKIIIIHVGSNTFGKKNSLTRFINNFHKLPAYLKEVIAIENDDKVFTIDDCLYLSEKLAIPVVLDYHHFTCNNTGKPIEEYLPHIIATWRNITPKMHFSSPKNKKEYRAHHDYINSNDFIKFLAILKKYNTDIDIMIEAKAKDMAMFKLIRELKYQTNYHFTDNTTFYVK